MSNAPAARFALEKARQMTLYSSETEQQLKLVKERLALDEGHGWAALAGNVLVSLGPAKLWFIALLISLSLILCVRRAWSVKMRWSFVLAALVPILVMLVFQLRTVAFVALKPIEIYEGPSKVFATGRALSAGSRVLGTIDGPWIKVSDANGDVSWLSRDQAALNAGWLWGQ